MTLIGFYIWVTEALKRKLLNEDELSALLLIIGDLQNFKGKQRTAYWDECCKEYFFNEILKPVLRRMEVK